MGSYRQYVDELEHNWGDDFNKEDQSPLQAFIGEMSKHLQADGVWTVTSEHFKV
jgi:hypothetical protein